MASSKISPQRIMRELAAIAFANVPDAIIVEGNDVHLRRALTPRQRAAIASIEKTTGGVKVKFYDKMKALELLGKHFGLFEGKDVQEQETENNLLAAILQATQQEVDIDEVSELQ